MEMNYGFTEEQVMMRDAAREIAQQKILPVRAQYDEEQHFPWDVIEVMAETGLFGAFISEAYGGVADGDAIMNMCIITEELSKACGGIALAYAGSGLGTLPIIISGNEEQKQKWLTPLAEGSAIAAFAITEPEAGSDAAGIRTTAVQDGDEYVLNGTKQWITNGGEAQIYTVFAMTDKAKGARGASCFVVEKDTPGFSFGKKEDKFGIRASATRELVFEDCRIPAANMLGKPGTGFMTAMKTFDASRPGVGSQAVGIMAGALEHAVDYSRERVQFGKPICANQGLQWMLADMGMKVEAARALVYATAKTVDAGAGRPTKFSAMSKCFASDMAVQVCLDAIQVYGGYGYMKEYPVEKYLRDAKITQIYEGTNQIQRDEIAKALIKESAARNK
jgi:alkylation response protein AidB-like acyl-CoA dehydrogenase